MYPRAVRGLRVIDVLLVTYFCLFSSLCVHYIAGGVLVWVREWGKQAGDDTFDYFCSCLLDEGSEGVFCLLFGREGFDCMNVASF